MLSGGVHDVGGVTVTESLNLSEHPFAFWEHQTHVINMQLIRKGIYNLDQFRRAIEALPEYNTMSYYERWAAAAAAMCIENGIFTRNELDGKLGPKLTDNAAKFKQGDVVRVKAESSIVRWRKPHLRTPGYIFGVVGIVERECVGTFNYPEGTAFGEDVPPQPLYRVRFRYKDVWDTYNGSDKDSIDIEIFQPWLEPADLHEYEQQATKRQKVELPPQAAALDHHHDHDHDDDHDDDHDHEHEERATVEQRAVDVEGDSINPSRVTDALLDLLVDKGVVTREQIRKDIEDMDWRGTKAYGAILVAKAWSYPDFKARLLSDAAAACAELGIATSNYPPPENKGEPAGAALAISKGTILTVVENTPEVHNAVVCTLCSCYPLAILGMAPHWYKSRSYRARMVRDPRGVLAEFGTVIPPEVSIRVHDSTAELRYLVLPMRPQGTEGWDEVQLRALVTRDSMIGVAYAKKPTG